MSGLEPREETDWRRQLEALHAEATDKKEEHLAHIRMLNKRVAVARRDLYDSSDELFKHRVIFGPRRDPNDSAIAEIERLRWKHRGAIARNADEAQIARYERHRAYRRLLEREARLRYEQRAKGHVIRQAKKWASFARYEKKRADILRKEVVWVYLWAIAAVSGLLWLFLTR